jgi:hypothetical protein
MNRFIRLVAFAVAVFALAGAPAFGFAQDKGDGSQSQPCSEEGKVSDPCTDLDPGAAGMEPEQALEDPAAVEESKAHQQWVEEIWNSP